jgi:GNAT superfamily N-acetyltransferase
MRLSFGTGNEMKEIVATGPLVVETQPRPEDVRVLEDGLYRFNVEATGIDDGTLFGVFLRDSDGTVVGGASGWIWAGTCHVQLLFVPEAARHQGQGTLLMRAVENEARSRGCGEIVLATYDFQAPAFYEKLGFTAVGELAQHRRRTTSLTMVKRLS